MAHDPEFPDFEAPPHFPTFEEVLQRLGNGTIGEVTDPALSSEGTSVVFFGQPQPEADTNIYAADSDVVYPFSRKFDRNSERWQLGDVVRVTTRIVDEEAGGVSLRSAMSSAYYDDIYRLDEADQAKIRDHGLARLDVDVEITGPEDYVVSNIFEYPTKLYRVNQVEPIWDGEQYIEKGEQVLAQGEVVEYVKPSYDKRLRDVPGSLMLRLASGRQVQVAVHETVSFERGALDVIRPYGPLPGETIQVHLGQNNGGRYAMLDKTPITFPLQASRDAYLVTPSPERLQVYQEHREAIASGLAELEQLDGAAFRQAAANLIREHLDIKRHPGAIYADNYMSAAEQQALAELSARKFPDAADGTPNRDKRYMPHKAHLDWLINVGETLGHDTLAMSLGEYWQFCEDLVTRRISSKPQSSRKVYPLSYLNYDFTPQQRLELFKKGCETWLPYTANKTALKADVAVTDPNTQLADYEDQTFYWVLSELSHLSNEYPAAYQYYLDQVAPHLDERRTWTFEGIRAISG